MIYLQKVIMEDHMQEDIYKIKCASDVETDTGSPLKVHLQPVSEAEIVLLSDNRNLIFMKFANN